MITVVGAGPAGSAVAHGVAAAGRAVRVVEAGDGTGWSVGESLPPMARPLLKDLGLWPAVARGPHRDSRGTLSAWGTDTLDGTDFLRSPYGSGLHLDRPAFEAALRQAAVDAGAEVHLNTTLRAAERINDGWRLTLQGPEGPETATASFLMDATGRRRAVARAQGGSVERPDRLIAFVARLRRSEDAPPDRQTRTLVEARPDGWWYTTRLPDDRRVAAFHTDADLADPRNWRTPDAFRDHLDATTHIAAAVDGYRVQEAPSGTAAGSERLEDPVGDGWCAVGDAALAFDPLSSQGLYTALYGALQVSHALTVPSRDRPVAWDRYRDRMASVWTAYRRHQTAFYAAESRWAERTFWQRRRK